MAKTGPIETTPATPLKRVFECKVVGCEITLTLETYGEIKGGVHSWTELIAETLIKQKKPRRAGAYESSPVSVSYSVAEFARCHLSRWGSLNDSLWVGGTRFKTRREDFSRLSEYLATLGIKIEDNSKGSRT